MHQVQTHYVSSWEDAKRIVMAISFLRQVLFVFFCQETSFLITPLSYELAVVSVQRTQNRSYLPKTAHRHQLSFYFLYWVKGGRWLLNSMLKPFQNCNIRYQINHSSHSYLLLHELLLPQKLVVANWAKWIICSFIFVRGIFPFSLFVICPQADWFAWISFFQTHVQ